MSRRINYLLQLYPIMGNSNPLGVRCSWSGYLEIYVIKLLRGTGTYWNTWGGWYDNPESKDLSVSVDGTPLTKVTSKANLLATVDSYYITGDNLYLNLTQYNYYSEHDYNLITQAEYYTTTAVNENDPSYPYINSNEYKTLLDIPSFSMKLSDEFSGLVSQQAFSLNLNNSDGTFDSAGNNAIKKYINANAILKRTESNNPTYASDWTIILSGTVDDFTTEYDKFTIQISDKMKYFSQPVCSDITAAVYTAAPDASIGKRIPIAFNQVIGAELIIIDDTAGAEKYLFVDSSYYTSITAVYDADGNTLTGGGTDYTNNADGTITMSAAPSAQPATIDFFGKSQSLGLIITTEIENHGGYAYTTDNWDTTETNVYRGASPTPGFVFSGSDVRSLITECMKNDLVYLISLPTGKMTLRRYTTAYTTHTLSAWQITQRPVKRLTNSNNWLSSVVLNSQNRVTRDESREVEASAIYGKTKEKEFTCDLYYVSPPIDEPATLAGMLADKYYLRREIMEIGISASVMGMKLLDSVTLDFLINNRQFTHKTSWKIIAIDYAQDKLTLEEA